ncbi:hypothetical protein [Marinactinospora rubrisoli]|uniref:Alpha/beta hydrolase n=1 Tax=Marinactinospora rubrisoli TaxID=2715399 RepID=A0ABW2KMD9_9ACTN
MTAHANPHAGRYALLAVSHGGGFGPGPVWEFPVPGLDGWR